MPEDFKFGSDLAEKLVSSLGDLTEIDRQFVKIGFSEFIGVIGLLAKFARANQMEFDHSIDLIRRAHALSIVSLDEVQENVNAAR